MHRRILSVCHPRFSNNMLRFVILFLPTSYSLAVRLLVASKLLRADITKSPPGRPIGRRQKRRSGQHRRALPSTDRHRVGTLPPALDHLVLLFLCALFFRFLSGVSFTSQHHTPPPVSTLSTILQRAHIGRRTLVPSFSTVPIQSACLPARHPENLTI